MYIGSTNLYLELDSPEYNSNIPSSLITSEKYYNCENFFSQTHSNQKKRKLFQKSALNKKG